MAEAAISPEVVPRKGSKKTLLVGLAAAFLMGGAGFYVTYSGLLLGGDNHLQIPEEADGHSALAFVALEPLIVSLGRDGSNQHLRFAAELEVAPTHSGEVTMLIPRIIDVLNGYLRAVDLAELEDPSALVRLRAQMLRRIQIVTGEGRVRDLLITEFVLN